MQWHVRDAIERVARDLDMPLGRLMDQGKALRMMFCPCLDAQRPRFAFGAIGEAVRGRRTNRLFDLCDGLESADRARFCGAEFGKTVLETVSKSHLIQSSFPRRRESSECARRNEKPTGFQPARE